MHDKPVCPKCGSKDLIRDVRITEAGSGQPAPWWILISWCLAVLGLGLLWLWWPVIDGAIEIFSPRSVWFGWPFEGLLILALTVVAFAFYSSVCSAAFMRRHRIAYIVSLLAPIGVLVGVGAILCSSGFDRTQRRVDSFQLGARWAVKRAGGAAKVRQDALAFIASLPETPSQPFRRPNWLAQSPWPDSFRRLHARTVDVAMNGSCVDIVILPTSCFADTFGYLIMSEHAPEPNIENLHGRQGHRLWKVDDGIYLYEEW